METWTIEGDRVRGHSAAHVNERIDALAEAHVREVARSGPIALGRRLAALDREWDVDRALMANFAVLGGASGLAAILRSTRRGRWSGFATLFTTQLGFLFLHAAVGWCPPLPVFRRLGFRTAKEIAAERRALERLAAGDGAER